MANAISNEPEMLGDLGSLLEARETAWLQPFHRSWESIEEDEQGMIKSTNQQINKDRKKALDAQTINQSINQSSIIEKGMIRYLCIILDFSDAMSVTDLKPSRRLVTLSLIQSFISDFFDANPLSQISLILAHKGIAIKITELNGHANQQINQLREKCEGLLLAEERASRTKSTNQQSITGGDFSLLNSLELARGTLLHVPPYASREVLLVTAALCSIDSSDLYQSINQCKTARIVCSIIHLAAELYVNTELASLTGGKHAVVLNKSHYESLLRGHVPPPPLIDSSTDWRSSVRRWMRMAFPTLTVTPHPLLCECHSCFTYQAYTCPQCVSRFCELPTQCTVCSLQLVSAPHLARTYHHLFQTPNWTLIDLPNQLIDSKRSVRCGACQRDIDVTDDILLSCSQCQLIHCIECDEFTHNVLHQCPSCQAHKTKDIKHEQEQIKSINQSIKLEYQSSAMQVG